jgi:hypothetical protein
VSKFRNIALGILNIVGLGGLLAAFVLIVVVLMWLLAGGVP